jgi:hypothetical protein
MGDAETTGRGSQQGGIVRICSPEEDATAIQGDAVIRQERADCFTWRATICKSKKLPALTRLVLHTIACHMFDSGDPCTLSVVTLCEETGLEVSQVKFHLKIAKCAGYNTDMIRADLKRKKS